MPQISGIQVKELGSGFFNIAVKELEMPLKWNYAMLF